jgi:hypothetical protein
MLHFFYRMVYFYRYLSSTVTKRRGRRKRTLNKEESRIGGSRALFGCGHHACAPYTFYPPLYLAGQVTVLRERAPLLGGAHLRELRQNSETASNLRLEVKKLASDSLLLILMTKDEKDLDDFKGFMLKNVLSVKKIQRKYLILH